MICSRIRFTILAACALLPLAGCGGGPDDRFAPPCPTPSIPRDFGDVRRYRGAGLDITDAVLEGRIIAVNGACSRDGANIVKANVSISMDLRRGPAATGRAADVSYFVAVSEGDRILDKRVYTLRAEFPSNTDRLRLTGEELELRLPVTAQKIGGVLPDLGRFPAHAGGAGRESRGAPVDLQVHFMSGVAIDRRHDAARQGCYWVWDRGTCAMVHGWRPLED